jgi:acetyl-CoA carboxylase biotin carboxyl carrier protein
MKLKEIKAIIDLVSEKGFAEFEIEKKGVRLRIRRFTDAPLSSPTPLIISSRGGAGELPPRRSEQRVVEVELQNHVPAPVIDEETAASEPAPQSEPTYELHTITSPIVGTFYRASSPTSEPFVRIGDQVEPESVVCIIEAMKLMNEIQAEVSGEVVKIFAENAQPVEYGQPLFGIKRI